MIAFLLSLACAVSDDSGADTAAVAAPQEIVATSGDCGVNPTPEGEVVGLTICGAPNGVETCRAASWQPQSDGSIYVSDCTAFNDDATWTMFDLH